MELQNLGYIQEVLRAEKVPFNELQELVFTGEKTFILKADGKYFLSKKQLTEEEALKTALEISSHYGKPLNEEEPRLLIKEKDYYRVIATIPPNSGLVTLTILFNHSSSFPFYA